MDHKLFHIVAASGNAMTGHGVIGKNNQLPWHYSEDLKFFKATTMGTTVIMGRKTFESIGKPLPGRENIVLSHSNLSTSPEVKVFHSINEALSNAQNENVFIIGGAELFSQTIDQVNGIYLTRVPGSYEGDVTYPMIPKTFKENLQKTKELKDRFKIDVVYLENTGANS